MDVVAGFDGLSRRPDDLAVFVDFVSLGDGADSDFVAELDGLIERDRSAGDFQVVALFEVAGGDADVVIGMQIHCVGSDWRGNDGHQILTAGMLAFRIS